jgi:hypothetical protein
MEDLEYDEFKSVREFQKEKKEKAKTILPARKSAQKEYIRDFLARNQEKFEECMDKLAEYDPKTYVTIYKDLTKHMIPKQSEVSVTHGLDEDFKQLAALAQTKTDNNALDVTQVPQIMDADFEEIKELGDGIS